MAELKEYSPQFGDIVKFRETQYFFLGMDEDGAYNMVRRTDDHAFGCVEFHQAWHDEWDELEFVSTFGLPQNITSDHVPWEPSPHQKAYQNTMKANPNMIHEEIMKYLGIHTNNSL